MKLRQHALAHGILVLAVLGTTSLGATTVLQMNLEQMSDHAEQIFRGTVLDVEEFTVQLGGGQVPAVRYTIRVDEAFKGNFDTAKDETVVEVSMAGTLKHVQTGRPAIPGLPVLQPGREYVLMVAAPGPVGLTTTMGLGQGCFNLFPLDKEEMVANELNNAGLFKGMGGGLPASGPISYAEFSELIRAALP